MPEPGRLPAKEDPGENHVAPSLETWRRAAVRGRGMFAGPGQPRAGISIAADPAGGAVGGGRLARHGGCGLVAQEAGKRLGQTLVVENKPGSSGIAGMLDVYRAAPDGYTLGYANNVTLAINRSTFSQLPYDPQKLTPVIFVLKVANVLAVNPDMPVKTLPEFVEYVRQPSRQRSPSRRPARARPAT